MLLKVEALQEIGRFSSLKHKAPQFGRLALIFARNGYGKSTICSILRSAATKDARPITARRRLGAVAESRVQTLWEASGAVTFSSGKWNASPDHVHVFDQEYVQQNLHVAENVTIANKRSLVQVILGSKGVELAKAISDLDAEQRDVTAAQTATEKVIRAACPVVKDVDAFCKAAVSDQIDVQIGAAEKGVALAQHSEAVKQRKDPILVVIPTLPHLEAIAARTLENISDQAAKQVKAHLDAHGMHPNGERWLKYGVEHMSDSACPFCTQDTSSIDLVMVFKRYFGKEYAALVAERDVAIEGLKSAYGEEGAELDRLLDANSGDFQFWSQVCDLGSTPALTTEERVSAKSAVSALIQLLERKVADPLAVLTLGDQKKAVDDGLALLDAYRERVLASTKVIQSTRDNIATPDVSAAREKLDKLKALKAKLASPLKEEVASWLTSTQRKSDLTKEKEEAQKALRDYVSATVSGRQDRINELLTLFGANFQIADAKASFVGREPNTDFSISLDSHVVKVGEAKDDQPSFKTILSAGDKFTLALAFFLTQVRADPNLAAAKIVLDDPFSSQDMQRQWETTSQIRALAKVARQVIVLSHDPRFLRLIEKDADPATYGSFQIMCDEKGVGAISAWSSTEELKEIYVRQAERIREFASTNTFLEDCTAESLMKDLRPFLEDFIRARFPARFKPMAMLGDMTDEIESAGITDPLFHDVAALRAINEYTRPSMHGGAPAPDPGQLRAQCKRVVLIIGSY